MSKQPRYSIVVPCYNEAAYIERTLKSLKRQMYQGDYEIIVVDNNSTDDTAAIAERLGARVVHEKRPGVCWARQRGTEAARGEIIISTDADSVFRADWLSNIDKRFNDRSDVVAVSGAFHYINGPRWAVYTIALFGAVHLVYKLTGRVFYAPAANFAFRKEAWDGYNTMMTQYGDEVDLLRKLQRKGKVVFGKELTVDTSPRRLRRGLLYNLFVSFFMYSFLEYNLNRLFGRRFFGQAPAFREGLEFDEEQAYAYARVE